MHPSSVDARTRTRTISTHTNTCSRRPKFIFVIFPNGKTFHRKMIPGRNSETTLFIRSLIFINQKINSYP